MRFSAVRDLLEKRAAELSLPYIDLRAIDKGRQCFACHAGTDSRVNGNEMLFFYSLTKPLTAVCALQLCERGLLSLFDSAAKYLPIIKEAYIEKDGKKVKVGEKITVEHLLTMSAGLNYDIDTPAIRALRASKPEPTPEEFLAAILSAPLLFEPGERFNYSLCMDVVGMIVEKASGKKLDEYMKENIFDPLGMASASFNPETPGIADQYRVENGQIKQIPTKNDFFLTRDFCKGGANLVCRVDDYVKFAAALANDGASTLGARILSAESLVKLRELHIPGEDAGGSFTCSQGAGYAYGLGVRTRTVATEWGLPVGEYGWSGAAGSYLLVDPQNHRAVVIGMHLLNWNLYSLPLHMELVRAVYECMNES